MSGYKYFCPSCYGMEIKLDKVVLITNEPKAHCQLCGWEGHRSDLIAGIEPSNRAFWTSERVGDTLLMVVSKYAAGPALQVLELIGVVPRIEGSREQQDSARAIREHVLKEVLGAVVTAAFTAAAEVVPQHYERFSPEMAQLTDQIFSFGGEDASPRHRARRLAARAACRRPPHREAR